MQAYPSTPARSNPVEPFTLTPFRPRVRKVLDEWVSRALAQIKPWRWDLRARLARTWTRNPNHTQGAHTEERYRRERQLRADLAWFHRSRRFDLVGRLPFRLRQSYASTVHQVERLVAGTWWEERAYVERRTGEVKATIYLPEDTWSAQYALNWCVDLLARLLAAVAGAVTDKTTPRYQPSEGRRGFGGGRGGSEEWDARLAFAQLAEKYGGAQPELPATR
jgi:hypothetical protein